MRTWIAILTAAVASVTLLVAGFWAWEQAMDLTADMPFSRPDVVGWAVRSAAVAAMALAQLVILAFVVGRLYRRRSVDEVLRLSAGVACVLAMVGAVALALAGH